MTSHQTHSRTDRAVKKSSLGTNMNLDLIDIILNDHKPIKELIKVMKDEDASFEEKKDAFEDFAPTLKSHAFPEEKTFYVTMKEDKETAIYGLEGDVEHGLADQLCEELKRERDQELFMAKVKVLAELVEHHIEEEEEDMLPEYKKNSSKEDREELGQLYLQFQSEIEAQGGDDAPKQGSREAQAAEDMAQKADH